MLRDADPHNATENEASYEMSLPYTIDTPNPIIGSRLQIQFNQTYYKNQTVSVLIGYRT